MSSKLSKIPGQMDKPHGRNEDRNQPQHTHNVGVYAPVERHCEVYMCHPKIANDVAVTVDSTLPDISQGNCGYDNLAAEDERVALLGHLAIHGETTVLSTQSQLSWPKAPTNPPGEESTFAGNKYRSTVASIPQFRPVDSNCPGRAQALSVYLPGTFPSPADDIHDPHGISIESDQRVMDNPNFHEFLDSIPDSDPTTLQSLLSDKTISENPLPNQCLLPGTEEARLGCSESNLTASKPNSIAHPYSPPHNKPSYLPDGKRKLPGLQQMLNDDCILRLYGETTGRRKKRQKKQGRQCMRCRLRNIKCSDSFPCKSCIEHWDKARNWTNEKRVMVWSHCFDARLEDLNILVDLTHSIMFAKTYPEKSSEYEKNRYIDAFKQFCYVKELVNNFGIDSTLRKDLESRYSGLHVYDKPPKGNPSSPPLSRLIHDIQGKLPIETWTMSPTEYRSWSPSRGLSIRLSEMVLLLFLHHEYIQEYTSLSSFEIYTLSMCYSHLFFEQIASHFKTGKIHAIPKDSSAATELAIDLGTLYFILSYGPAHFQSLNLFGSTDSPSVKSAHVEGAKMSNASLSPEDSLPTKTTSRYVLAELDKFLQKDDSSKSAKGRHLPFKAAALPERWGFLKDYISHWVDRLGLCSTDPTIVTSSLVLAHRLCRVSLLDTDGMYNTCQRAGRPILPLDMEARNPVRDLLSLCRQMQEHWTPQKATKALHGFLGDRKVLIWHLIALWDQNANSDDPEEPLDLQDLTRLPHMFPSGITAKAGNIQMLESQVRRLHGVFTEPPEEIHVIERQWRAISDNVSLTMPALQQEDDNRVRQFTLESYLKRIWT